MALTDDDVWEILRIIDEAQLAELRLETESFSLHVVRDPSGGAAELSPAPPGRAAGDTSRPSVAPAASDAPPVASPASDAPPVAPAASDDSAADDDTVSVPSPMLGVFYRAEAPGAAPLIDVGATVAPDTIVCIIEVMKMMNSIAAGVSGTVVEICPDNAQLVEYGQPLIRVRPT